MVVSVTFKIRVHPSPPKQHSANRVLELNVLFEHYDPFFVLEVKFQHRYTSSLRNLFHSFMNFIVV